MRRVRLCISRLFGLCGFRSVEQVRQVAATVDDTLDAYRSGNDAEEDNITAHYGEARPFANFGTKLIKKRLLPDAVNLMPDLPDEGNCPLRDCLRR